MIGPGAMPRSRTFPRPNDRCTGGARGNQIAPRERDRRTDRGRRRRGSRRNARTKKGQYEEGARGGEGARAGRKGRKGQRGATRAGNYMAFVSDGAFNDLSIPRRDERRLSALSRSRPRRAAPRARARARCTPAKNLMREDASGRSNRVDPIEFAVRIRRGIRADELTHRGGTGTKRGRWSGIRAEASGIGAKITIGGIEARGSTRRGQAERDRPRV